MKGDRVYLIINDNRGIYFVCLGLGMFWECTSDRSKAREFPRRRDASRMLTSTGKQHEGWRIVAARRLN